jgi:sugar/nucleoside kinase (ribokinase family)
MVYPSAFEVAPHILPHLDALILSREDLLAPPGSGPSSLSEAEADAQIAEWARITPMVAVTHGAQGADLYLNGQQRETFSGYPAREVDPTGAGDVFAAAFLLRLHESGDPRAAVDFANRVAALSVEGEGVQGIPTRAALLARYPGLSLPE